MAFIHCNDTGGRFYLKAYHIVGRLASSADTVISSPEVSKIHAVIEWSLQSNGGYWSITDLSTNGVWVNGDKITKAIPQLLAMDDVISFSANQVNSMTLADISSPKDLLLNQSDSNLAPIELNPYLLLPNDEQPEIALFFDELKANWFYEVMNSSHHESVMVKDGQTVHFGKQDWSLLINAEYDKTEVLTADKFEQPEAQLVLDVSLDEEMIEARLQLNNKTINFSTRTHHYLTLLLARKRLKDTADGLAEFDQGWYYSDQLSKDMGLDACHLNIHVHRARKQFAEQCQQYLNLPLFERKTGRIRINLTNIIINKGGKLEQNIA